jgi:hypothetical protein
MPKTEMGQIPSHNMRPKSTVPFSSALQVSRSSAVAAALALSPLSPAQFAALFSPVVILQTDEQLVRGTGG